MASSKVDRHRADLRGLKGHEEWTSYLLRHSDLPGPRANLELVEAFAWEAPPGLAWALAGLDPAAAPGETGEEFLTVCGAAALGRLLADAGAGGSAHVPEEITGRLRVMTGDPRWRVREAVCMALQYLGRRDFASAATIARQWAAGTPLEQRAAIAALAEPDLIADPHAAAAALDLIRAVTAAYLAGPRPRRSEDLRVLRQALGYCWSVILAARPTGGQEEFVALVDEALAPPGDPDLLWIVRQNLSRKRLERLDPQWVAELSRRLSVSGNHRPPSADKYGGQARDGCR